MRHLTSLRARGPAPAGAAAL
jgi:hypothetical protein